MFLISIDKATLYNIRVALQPYRAIEHQLGRKLFTCARICQLSPLKLGEKRYTLKMLTAEKHPRLSWKDWRVIALSRNYSSFTRGSLKLSALIDLLMKRLIGKNFVLTQFTQVALVALFWQVFARQLSFNESHSSARTRKYSQMLVSPTTLFDPLFQPEKRGPNMAKDGRPRSSRKYSHSLGTIAAHAPLFWFESQKKPVYYHTLAAQT